MYAIKMKTLQKSKLKVSTIMQKYNTKSIMKMVIDLLYVCLNRACTSEDTKL